MGVRSRILAGVVFCEAADVGVVELSVAYDKLLVELLVDSRYEQHSAELR